ncbi:MAG: phosphatidate cytidylyltransferase [Promethearchaeota archaeon]
MIIGWNIAVLFENLVYGTGVLYSLIKHWNEETKKPHRLNELLYVILFYTFGIASMFLFENDNLSYHQENMFYFILYMVYLSLDIFWWIFNLIPNIIKCRKDPEEKKRRDYNKFVQFINEHQGGANLKGDLTRKLLHLIMFLIVVLAFVVNRANQTAIEAKFEDYWAFTKFLYTLIAYAFVYMFTLADLMRHNMFYALPNWARKWYGTSLAPREVYTFISSIPYVLTLSLFQFAPYQILFIASGISTFADAAASIIGKRFGKHKFPEKFDPKKSFEGLFAGIFMGFLTPIALLYLFPFPNQSDLFVLLTGLGCAIIFACTDLFITKIADNITNVFLPGILTWTLLYLF